MSNGTVLKNNFIQLTSKNTRVINPNDLFAKRMEGFSGVLREKDVPVAEEPQYESGGDESIDALTEEYDGEYTGEYAGQEQEENAESYEEQCRVLLENANAEADKLIEKAKSEAEAIRSRAYDEGYEEGYSKGRDEALSELLEAKKQLEEERSQMDASYKEKLREMEPEIVNVITDVYEHVFGANFYSRRDVMVSLINKALISADTDEQMIIHASSADYDMLVGMKAMLFEKVAYKSEPEIRQRDDFVRGQAKIETPYGILDCSIDTELKELKRMLKVLSYEGNGEV